MTEQEKVKYREAAELLFGYVGRWAIDQILPKGEATTEAADAADERELSKGEVCRELGSLHKTGATKMAYSTLTKLIAEKKFPPPDRIDRNTGRPFWNQSTVDQAIESGWQD